MSLFALIRRLGDLDVTVAERAVATKLAAGRLHLADGARVGREAASPSCARGLAR